MSPQAGIVKATCLQTVIRGSGYLLFMDCMLVELVLPCTVSLLLHILLQCRQITCHFCICAYDLLFIHLHFSVFYFHFYDDINVALKNTAKILKLLV